MVMLLKPDLYLLMFFCCFWKLNAGSYSLDAPVYAQDKLFLGCSLGKRPLASVGFDFSESGSSSKVLKLGSVQSTNAVLFVDGHNSSNVCAWMWNAHFIVRWVMYKYYILLWRVKASHNIDLNNLSTGLDMEDVVVPCKVCCSVVEAKTPW